MRKRALAGTKVLQKNEGKKLKFYDVPHLTYHVLQAGYDVNYFGDKGLGLRAVYVALGCGASEAGRRPVYTLTSRCASLTSGRMGLIIINGVANAAPLDPRCKRGPVEERAKMGLIIINGVANAAPLDPRCKRGSAGRFGYSLADALR